MKYVLALIGGFALTLIVFGSGAMLATAYFVGKPEQGKLFNTASVWQSEPVRVSAAPQATEAGEPKPGQAMAAEAPAADEEAMGIDETVTGAIASDAEPDREAAGPDPQRKEMAARHIDWCYDRYRSYRPEDNSYQPFNGRRRACVSPFMPGAMAGENLGPDAFDEAPETIEVSMDDPYSRRGGDRSRSVQPWEASMSQEHVQSCFARYQSYRPADNTYQPYGGGPRRQCE